MKVKENTFADYRNNFDTEQKCTIYLASLKWANCYTSRKYKHNNYVKGRIRLDSKALKIFL